MSEEKLDMSKTQMKKKTFAHRLSEKITKKNH